MVGGCFKMGRGRAAEVGKKIQENYLKRPQQSGRHHIHLPSAHIPPETHMVPRPEMKHCPLHLAHFLLTRLRPTLRPESVDVLAKNLLVTLHGPLADSDDSAGGVVLAADLGPAGWDDAFELEAGSRVHAESFLDARVHIGQILLGKGEVDVAG